MKIVVGSKICGSISKELLVSTVRVGRGSVQYLTRFGMFVFLGTGTLSTVANAVASCSTVSEILPDYHLDRKMYQQ